MVIFSVFILRVLFYTRSHLAALKVLLYSHFNSKVYLGIYDTLFPAEKRATLLFIEFSGSGKKICQLTITWLKYLDVPVIKNGSFQSRQRECKKWKNGPAFWFFNSTNTTMIPALYKENRVHQVNSYWPYKAKSIY